MYRPGTTQQHRLIHQSDRHRTTYHTTVWLNMLSPPLQSAAGCIIVVSIAFWVSDVPTCWQCARRVIDSPRHLRCIFPSPTCSESNDGLGEAGRSPSGLLTGQCSSTGQSLTTGPRDVWPRAALHEISLRAVLHDGLAASPCCFRSDLVDDGGPSDAHRLRVRSLPQRSRAQLPHYWQLSYVCLFELTVRAVVMQHNCSHGSGRLDAHC